MTIDEHLSTFMRLPIEVYRAGLPLAEQSRRAVDEVAWRLGAPYDNSLGVVEAIRQAASDPDAGKVQAAVLGAWASWEGDESADGIAEALVAAHDRFAGLRGLVFSDVVMEESEISWIEHTDISPILAAYPRLEDLLLRGGGIGFGRGGHEKLRRLVVQSGGMVPGAVEDLSRSAWPALEHLELWLGTGEYGGGAGPSELAALLAGEGLPRLRFLGLMDSDRQDEVTAAVVGAPIVERIEVLDLSMGTLSDDGARALLGARDRLGHLRELRLRWHYIGDDLAQQLAAWPNVRGIDERADGDDDYRYVEVAE